MNKINDFMFKDNMSDVYNDILNLSEQAIEMYYNDTNMIDLKENDDDYIFLDIESKMVKFLKENQIGYQKDFTGGSIYIVSFYDFIPQKLRNTVKKNITLKPVIEVIESYLQSYDITIIGNYYGYDYHSMTDAEFTTTVKAYPLAFKDSF